MNQKSPPGLWSGQLLHFLTLTILLVGTWFLWVRIERPFPLLFWLVIGIPIVHQLFVWVAWRFELKSKTISNSIGFTGYRIIFFILLLARPIAFLILAWVDRESLGLNISLRIIISALLFIPALYTMYSIKKYFGFVRAAGADHFDIKYCDMPLVKKGIFKYSGNSMYTFGFLVFWAIAIAFDSKASLLAAAFGHAYIWVHYYATEKPDMDYLYGNRVQ